MKKLIKTLVVAVLSASLITGCGGNGNTGDSQQVAQESTQENSQENSGVNAETEAVYPTGELMTPAESFAGGDGSK